MSFKLNSLLFNAFGDDMPVTGFGHHGGTAVIPGQLDQAPMLPPQPLPLPLPMQQAAAGMAPIPVPHPSAAAGPSRPMYSPAPVAVADMKSGEQYFSVEHNAMVSYLTLDNSRGAQMLKVQLVMPADQPQDSGACYLIQLDSLRAIMKPPQPILVPAPGGPTTPGNEATPTFIVVEEKTLLSAMCAYSANLSRFSSENGGQLQADAAKVAKIVSDLQNNQIMPPTLRVPVQITPSA